MVTTLGNTIPLTLESIRERVTTKSNTKIFTKITFKALFIYQCAILFPNLFKIRHEKEFKK
ncbi:hypothetical protein BpHYR1_043834 [Brachionus plicatilis]|uniref:Uncharacterized protein n=1 Tax=Brachionus plicatilis TaxID=10195 RepID=A0A3M7RWX1_BRAPC|nr:hypothetical protein BpHYR1_043834 [Brachionus plicatilis]